MKRLRRTVMLAGLTAIAALAVVSVVGAFIGAEAAKALFNSVPLTAFWLVLAVLLVAGVLAGGIVRSPGLLAAHLGALLVIGGGMYGSDTGHAVAARLFGVAKIPTGYMIIDAGHASSTVIDADGRKIGELPFSVALRDFWIEYYSRPGPWRLGAVTPPIEPGLPPREEEIHWSAGRAVAVELIGARVEVLGYIPSARATDSGGAEPDAETHLPAMEVRVTRGGEELRGWLIPRGDAPGVLSLEPLLGPTMHDGHSHGAAYLVLARPVGPVKDYKSSLVVLTAGQQAAEKTIEVNDPLHFGGYHFYQHACDDEGGQYTVLLVKSDSGLPAVWAGFALLCAGVFWSLWGRPAWGYFARRGGDDDQV